jgi:hypothetical protein
MRKIYLALMGCTEGIHIVTRPPQINCPSRNANPSAVDLSNRDHHNFSIRARNSTICSFVRLEKCTKLVNKLSKLHLNPSSSDHTSLRPSALEWEFILKAAWKSIQWIFSFEKKLWIELAKNFQHVAIGHETFCVYSGVFARFPSDETQKRCFNRTWQNNDSNNRSTRLRLFFRDLIVCN